MTDLKYAAEEKMVLDRHDVVDEAIREEADVSIFNLTNKPRLLIEGIRDTQSLLFQLE